jgi:PAS domain S-box-containing protein
MSVAKPTNDGVQTMAAKKKHTRRAKAPEKPQPAHRPAKASEQSAEAPAAPAQPAPLESRRNQAAAPLSKSEERLRLALEAGNMGTWDWNITTDALLWDSRQFELFGIPPQEFREVGAQALARIHPEDRPRVHAATANARGHGAPFREEFRVVHPDDSVHWLVGLGHPLKDASGKVTRIIGINFDITDQKRAENALRQLNDTLEQRVYERTRLLRDREERLQAVLNTTRDAIVTIDYGGIIQSVNGTTERMFGYTGAEMIGQNVTMLMASPYREAHDGYIARYLQTGEKHVIGISREAEARRKDGSVFPVDITVSEIKHLKLFTGVHRDLTDRKRLEREVVEVASLEQRRIGQDLHDTVAQELTALNLLARDLGETLRTEPAKASKLVEQMAHGLRRSQQELRAVLRGLLPVAVDSEGLMAALADLADRTQQEGKVTCTFDCSTPVSVADNLTATHLYLIAQEAVHNAVKHARAHEVRISLGDDGRLVLGVRDNGVGMPGQPAKMRGLGLRIMRNRAAIIGATLTIKPAKPSGTIVTCTLARTNNAQKAQEPSPSSDRR